jgi:tetratricopeptide (TPR) repeat protein
MNAHEIQQKMIDSMGINSEQIAALLITGHCCYTQGRLEDARKIFEGLVVLDGSNHYVHGILGSVYQRQNQFDLALLHYSNAITLFPNDVNALTNRGEIFVKLGRFQEAAEDFTKAIQLDPDRKDSAANRARLLVSIVQDALTLAKENGISALEDVKKRLIRN